MGDVAGFNVEVTSGRGVTGFTVGHLTRAGTLQSLDRNPQAERGFWERSIKSVFKDDPSWKDLIRRRLEAMQ